MGEHEVLFIGTDEIIELTHRALRGRCSRRAPCARPLSCSNRNAPRVYNMNDIVNRHKTVTRLYMSPDQAVG